MLGKGVKCPLSWSFVAENIVDVEHINLKPKIQRLLGCSINEQVFLEYPFAYVPSEIVKSHSMRSGSPFENCREKLELYKESSFLVGYASKELTSEKFIICLSEEARDRMVRRNREVTMRILDHVRVKVEKTPRSWRSLGTEDDLDSSFMKNARPYYEVEISLPICFLRKHRELADRTVDDARDGYVKIVPQYEVFENVEMLLTCKAIQTNLVSRENSVQTYPGHPKKQWTQYEYDCFPKQETAAFDEKEVHEKENSQENEKSVSKQSSHEIIEEYEESTETILKKASSIEFFLGDHIEEMIDVIRYNTVINPHSDDLSNLAQGVVQEPSLTNLISYKEHASLINLNFSKMRVISSISWHPHLHDIVAICYVEGKGKEVSEEQKLLTTSEVTCDDLTNTDNKRNKEKDNDPDDLDNEGHDSEKKSEIINEDIDNESDNDKANNMKANDEITENGVLIWSLSDSLYPKTILSSHQIIQVVSFCPYKADILIGGSSTGQIMVWDLRGLLDFDENLEEIPITNPIALSNIETSHILLIRDIRWLPCWYNVGSDGSLQKSTTKSLQFVTASDDGSLAIWDLCCQEDSRPYSKTRKTDIFESFDPKKLDGVLRPVYQIKIQHPKESWRFSPLCICIPLITEENQGAGELDARTNEQLRKFLVGTLEGELIYCSWEGQDFGTEDSSWESCNFINRSFIHDGPVLEISRCPFLDDVILTIGGRIFAIWKDDYLDSPLLWRRSSYSYTSSCWSNRAGMFLLARVDGELEIWDVTRKTQDPVLSQFISRGPITGLYPRLSSRVIGICDYNGAFRIFIEPEESKEESLERVEWFEEFVWREVKRKRNFFLWESDFLKTNPKAVERKKSRDSEEAKRKHQEAREHFQKGQEELARKVAELQARMVKKPKAAIWKLRDYERMRNILLQKKGFVPKKLEKSRLPLVVQEKERSLKLKKAKKEICLRGKYFKAVVSAEFPSIEREDESEFGKIPLIKGVQEDNQKNYNEEFLKVREDAQRKLNENPYVSEFNWNAAMKEGRRQQMMMEE